MMKIIKDMNQTYSKKKGLNSFLPILYRRKRKQKETDAFTT